MRQTITLLFILLVNMSFATDRVVNPNLSQGNGTTVFVTITDAVAAAQNGDRIIITSSSYNEGVLTIDKSLQIIPLNSGGIINYNANINIVGFSGMKVEIIGFDLGVYGITSSSGGTIANRAKVSIINCSLGSIDLDQEGFDCYIIANNISDTITYRYGYIASNTVENIYVEDEAQDSPDNPDEKNLVLLRK